MKIISDKDTLRERSLPVAEEEGRALALELIRILSESPGGIGLAAPQIGVSKRVFVIERDDGRYMSFVNPEILDRKGPYINKGESCLSFPEARVDTIRYKEIEFKNGSSLSEKESLVFQHEYDHLDGVLLFDRGVPKKYDECFCGSKEKYKFCCLKKMK